MYSVSSFAQTVCFQVLEGINMEMHTTKCPVCGIRFDVPDFLLEMFIETGRTHFCPLGHHQNFTNKNKQKLEQAGKDVQMYSNWWKTCERSNRNLRGQITKLKNKLAAM